MTTGLVIGMDMSLRATGFCFDFQPAGEDSVVYEWSFKWQELQIEEPPTNKAKKMSFSLHVARLAWYKELFDTGFIRRVSDDAMVSFGLQDAELLVIEDYAAGSRKTSSLTAFGEQRGILYSHLLDHGGVRNLLIVNPTHLKMFGCGAQLDKDIFVQKVARKYNMDFESSHECDAFILAMFGRAVLNWQKDSSTVVLSGEGKKRLWAPAHLKNYEARAILRNGQAREILRVDEKGESLVKKPDDKLVRF